MSELITLKKIMQEFSTIGENKVRKNKKENDHGFRMSKLIPMKKKNNAVVLNNC